MKTRFKIIIPIITVLVVFSLLFLRPSDDVLVICEGQILNLEQCTEKLNKKYRAIPAVSHFLEITDYKELGLRSENFQAYPILGGAIENNLVASMEINPQTNTVTYRCAALVDPENIFVEIKNPTMEDIDNNRCRSFDSSNLKSRDDLRCEQIGGDQNHPEYEGCVLPSTLCNVDSDDNMLEECKTGHDLCKDLGGKIIESLSCRESVREQYAPDPVPCDFRGPAGCEFQE